MSSASQPQRAPLNNIEIDISRAAKRLGWLRYCDFVLILAGVSCIGLMEGIIANLITNGLDVSLFLIFILIFIYLFGAYTGFKHISVINPQDWPKHIFSFFLIIPVSIALFLLSTIFLLSASDKNLNTSLQYDLSAAGNISMSAGAFMVPMAILGLISIFSLRRQRFEQLNIRLKDLLLKLNESDGRPKPSISWRHRVNAPKGIMLLLIGGVLLFSPPIVLTPIVTFLRETTTPFLHLPGESHRSAGEQKYLFDLFLAAPLSQASLMLGCFLLFLSRRYFQVNADSLLAADGRAPILFLRSFGDDKRSSFYQGASGLLDFSLEVRLKHHFVKFGPFIAVGSPKDGLPEPGAARAYLLENQWRERVVSWMQSSKYIIMYLGTTAGLRWELSKLVELKRESFLILLIPEFRSWIPFRRKRNVKARFKRKHTSKAAFPALRVICSSPL